MQCQKCSLTVEKYERGPFGLFNIHSLKKKNRKNLNGEKTEKRDPSISRGTVCYAEKPFWFSSLGRMIQFGTIKFRRTLYNYFGQFVWIEK